MSVYLGQDKVGVSYLTSTNIYDSQETSYEEDIYTPWVRPEGWPDLDSLNLEMSGTDSFIYMTYRTGHIDDVCSFHVNTTSGSATVEIGTVSNGVFTANSTLTIASNTDKTYWLTSNEGYSEGTIVFKITGKLYRFYLRNVSREPSTDGTIYFYQQPLLERIWYMPEMTLFTSSAGNHGCGTMTLERDVFNNGDGTALTSCVYAWWYCYNLQSLDITGLKTLNVTTFGNMFLCCRKLESLDVSHFNTAKVTYTGYMFDECMRIKELDLSDWNTNALSGGSLLSIFRYCYALREIKGLENIYTNNVTTLNSTFAQCNSLENLDGVTHWNTGKVTSLASTFSGCYKIKALNLSYWDVSKVTSVTSMFYQCYNLKHINFPQVLTSTISGAISSFFNSCYNLQEVDLTWIKPITNAVTSIGYMFSNCRSLKEINIPEGWDITGCTASEACYRIFADCYALLRITGISNWDMSNYNYSLAYSFQYDYCLKEIDIKNWKPHPTSMYYFFYECRSLLEIDLTGWYWNNLTGSNGLSCVFSYCRSLKSIKGIEHMGDYGNTTGLSSLFIGCYSLTSIPNIDSWDVSKVTTTANMFLDCRSLKSIRITGWNLAKCTAITNMFRYCYSLEEIELTNWSIPALTTVPDYIFSSLYSLHKCSGLPIALNHRYQNCNQLPEDLWARIFTQLPTVSGKTLYMTTANINRLTAATKAIATNKGWTLAN